MRAKSFQSFLTVCNPMDCSQPGVSVHGILQAAIVEWVAIPSSGDLPDPGIGLTSLRSPASAGGLFTSVTWEAQIHVTELIFYRTVRSEIKTS